MRKTIRTWWSLHPRPGNLGDILTPILLRNYGYFPERVAREEAEWLFVGSTIRFARPGAYVVGSGAISMQDRLEPRAKYLAVRGPLTASLVRNCGVESPSIQGDPALLLPRFIRSKAAKECELGLIPHYIDRADPRVLAWRGRPINVLWANPLEVIDQITRCEAVLSSSLHGIILSHAYGVPAAWVRLGDRLDGDDTKFHDYAASVGLSLRPYARFEEAVPVLPRTIDTEPLHQLFASL